MDLEKYRRLFLEEVAEHLAELGRALAELEKDPADAEAIDAAFRMAHSIKGMAATLSYDGVVALAHCLEERMQRVRGAGCADSSADLPLLLRGLDALEALVAAVREGNPGARAAPELLEELAGEGPPVPEPDRLAAAPAPAVAEGPASGLAGATAPTAARTPRELLRPPPTVRVRTETLDRFLATVGEVILTSSQLRALSDSAGSGDAGTEVVEGFDRMERVVGELQRRALDLRTVPLLRVVEPLPRLARTLARDQGKRVRVELAGAELELDRSILDRLSDPLVHLVRNAVDHGLEPPEERRRCGKDEVGTIRVAARREREAIRIEVRDDGRGLDLASIRRRAAEAGLLHPDLAEDLPDDQVAELVFRPGLSTARRVSEISGRGVGMDAVRATLESLGGRVEISSRAGEGTAAVLVVPVTAAVQRVLLVGLGGEVVALPIGKVEQVVEVPAHAVERSGSERFVLLEDEPVPVLDLADSLRFAEAPPAGHALLVLAEVRGSRAALRVDRLVGQQEIFVKPVPELLSPLRALAGLTVLADGRPVFLVDPALVS